MSLVKNYVAMRSLLGMEITRHRSITPRVSEMSIKDHGLLEGLADDDHLQYHNNERGDLRYPPLLSGYERILPCEFYSSIEQGTWSFLIDPLEIYNYLWYNTSNAQNDQMTWSLYAPAGVQWVFMLGAKDPNSANPTVYVDGVSKGVIAMYSAVRQYNKTFIKIPTLTYTGLHTISLKAATRNVASLGWQIYVSWVQIS